MKVAHSPDLSPSDFHLFLHLKKHLAGQKFHENEEVKNKVSTWFCAQAAELYDIGKQKLIPRLNKYHERCGDMLENGWRYVLKILLLDFVY